MTTKITTCACRIYCPLHAAAPEMAEALRLAEARIKWRRDMSTRGEDRHGWILKVGDKVRVLKVHPQIADARLARRGDIVDVVGIDLDTLIGACIHVRNAQGYGFWIASDEAELVKGVREQ